MRIPTPNLKTFYQLLLVAAMGGCASAHADSFSTSNADALRMLNNRLSGMEAELRSVTAQLATAQAAAAAAAEGDNAKSGAALPGSLPAPPKYPDVTEHGLDILAPAPFTDVGMVNGMRLVRIGNQLQALSEADYTRITNLEVAKARKQSGVAAQTVAAISTALGALPTPPEVASTPVAKQVTATKRNRAAAVSAVSRTK